MPLPTIDFSRFMYTPEPTGIGEIFEHFDKGRELANAPHKRAAELMREQMLAQLAQEQAAGKRIENQYLPHEKELGIEKSQLENQYYAPGKEAEMAHKRAQIAEALANANRTNSGGDFSGTLGNIIRLDKLKKNPNADPELIKQLQAQIDLDKKREETLQQYQEGLSNSLYYRSATPSQKLMMNIDMLGKDEAYDMEGNKVKLTPAQSKQRRGLLEKEAFKYATDQPERERLNAASRMAATISTINPDEAFKYSGGLGGMSKLLEKGKGALNKEQSKEYKKFEENLTRLEVLSHQASQFFDLASAQKIQKDVKELANPQTWFRNPEIAKAKYKALVDVFNLEHNTMMKSAIEAGQYGLNISSAGEETAPKEPYQELSDTLYNGVNSDQDLIWVQNPKTKEMEQIPRFVYEKHKKRKKK